MLLRRSGLWMRDVEVDLALHLGNRLGAGTVHGGDVGRRLAFELFFSKKEETVKVPKAKALVVPA